MSPYAFVGDSPVVNAEIDGEIFGTVIGGIIGGVRAKRRGEKVWKGVLKGAASGLVADLTAVAVVASAGTAAPAVAVAIGAGAASGGAGAVADGLIWEGKVKAKNVAAGIAIGGVTGGLGYKIASAIRKLRSLRRNSSIEVGTPSASFTDDVLEEVSRGPSDFIGRPIEMIADNPQMLSLWNNTLRNAAQSSKDNIYKRYLTALEDGSIASWSNDDLARTFSYVRNSFQRLARREGVEVDGQIHHWNYPKSDFPDQITNPGNLTTPVTRAEHQLIHQQTSSTTNIWRGPVRPDMTIDVNSTPYTPPPSGGN